MSLVIENSPSIDSLTFVTQSPKLATVRLLGVNWTLSDDSTLERLYGMTGLDEKHNSTPRAVLTGNIHVTTIRERNLAKYQEAWTNLTITYDNLIRQFTVSFYNAEDSDGNNELLDTQYVDVNGYPEDPTTRETNPITPTLDPTISTIYTFTGWDRALGAVTGNQAYTAVYSESPRTYTVTYSDGHGTILQRTTNCPYGSYVPYVGYSGEYTPNMNIAVTGDAYTAAAEAKQAIIPTYTSGEAANTFYLFREWDKSGYVSGYSDTAQTIIGDKVITALYDMFQYSSNGNINSFTDGSGKYKSLNELTPIELYAMKRLEESHAIVVNNGNDNDDDDFIAIGDTLSIAMGNDIDYEDVESHTFVSLSSPLVLNGSTKVDYSTIPEHSAYANFLSDDRDFVFAVEYTFSDQTGTGSALVSCFDDFTKTGLQISSS